MNMNNQKTGSTISYVNTQIEWRRDIEFHSTANESLYNRELVYVIEFEYNLECV